MSFTLRFDDMDDLVLWGWVRLHLGCTDPLALTNANSRKRTMAERREKQQRFAALVVPSATHEERRARREAVERAQAERAKRRAKGYTT